MNIKWGLLLNGDNPYFSMFGVLFLIIYTGPGRMLFKTWPLPGDVWLLLLVFPPLLLLLDGKQKEGGQTDEEARRGVSRIE